MSRSEVVVELTPDRGRIFGTLDQRVFSLAKLLRTKKWVRGELFFDPSEVELVRRHLGGATWLDQEEGVGFPSSPAPSSEHVFKRPPIGRQLAAFEKGRWLDVFALFMWMGTGKTFVALNLAARWWADGEIERVLVAAPKGVDKQWLEKQLPLHTPDWCPWVGRLHRAGKKIRWDDTQGGSLGTRGKGVLRWLFMNVEAWSSASGQKIASEFVAGGKTLIIVDESTRIKSPSAERAKFAVKLGLHANVRKKLILTGLPVTRGVEDLFMQFKFLDWQIMGLKSIFGFVNTYCVVGGWRGKQIISYKHVDHLLSKIEPYVFIAPRLPGTPTTFLEREHELTAEQRRIYRDLKETLVAYVEEHRHDRGGDRLVSAAHAGAGLIKLQQVTNGYVIDDQGNLSVLSRERFELLGDVVEEAGEQRCLVFCRFHYDMDFVGEELTRRKIRWGEYSGRNPGTRDEELARLKRGELDVLVMTAASGGVGLDVPEASCAIYFSNSFDFEHRTQSLFRMDRLGQTRDITIVDLFGSPIDRFIFKSYDKKESISDMVLSIQENDI